VPLVLRGTKGARLTHAEMDANLSGLADGSLITGTISASVAGLVIGTDVQAWDADLDAIAALAKTDGNFVVGDGAAWVAEAGATARTSLGASASGDTVFTGTAAAGFGALKQDATTAATGVVELATQAEMDAGTAGKVPTTDLNRIALDTPVTLSTQTEVDFTVSAGTTRITATCDNVSTNGTSVLIFQLGDSGGIEVTDYTGTGMETSGGGTAVLSATTGFALRAGNAATAVQQATVTIVLVDAATNKWQAFGVGRTGGDADRFTGTSGIKSLSGELTTVRFTTVNGTDTFDAGSVNVQTER